MTTTLEAANALKAAWAATVDQVAQLAGGTEEDMLTVAEGFAIASNVSSKSMIQKFRAIRWALGQRRPQEVVNMGQERVLSAYRSRNREKGPGFERRKQWARLYPESQHDPLNAAFERIRVLAGLKNAEDEADWLIAHLNALTPTQVAHDAQNIKDKRITGQT
jgi:hypothetical protein